MPNYIFRGIFLTGLMLISANAHAAGTLAGTSISNIATLVFSVNTIPQAPISSNVASFIVDHKVNLSVTTSDTSEIGAAIGQSGVVTNFVVTNLGNTTEDYALTDTLTGIADPFGSGTTFNVASCSIHVEDGTTPGYQAGQDLATFIGNLAPDASAKVYLVCNIPSSATSNQVSAVALTATTRAAGTSATGVLTQTSGPNTNGVDIVFADTQAPLAGVAGDALRDAAASAASAYKIGLSVVLNKSVLCAPNPACLTAFKPGDTVTYQIQVNLSGVGTAIALVVQDPIPTNLTYVPGSITVNGAARTDLIDADNSDFTANTVDVNLGNVLSPNTFLIQFKALVN